MEQFVGMSKTGSIKEAAEGLKNPQFLMLFDSSKERFKESVSQLEEMFPGVPSIGCVGQFYGKTQVLENGVMVVGFSSGCFYRCIHNAGKMYQKIPAECYKYQCISG